MSRRRINMAEALGGGEEEEGELNLTPYLDIITTLVIFMIFTFQVVIEFRLVDVMAPQLGKGGGASTEKPPVTVTLIITDAGFRVLASDGIAPSEIPKKGDKYDFDKLHETLVTWKSKLSLGEGLILMAQENTEYSLVVETMDAVRNDGKNLLFPDVALAVGVTGGAK